MRIPYYLPTTNRPRGGWLPPLVLVYLEAHDWCSRCSHTAVLTTVQMYATTTEIFWAFVQLGMPRKVADFVCKLFKQDGILTRLRHAATPVPDLSTLLLDDEE